MGAIRNNTLLTDKELSTLEKCYSGCKSIKQLRDWVSEDCEFENSLEGHCIRMSFDESYGISVANNPDINERPKGFEVHFIGIA